MTRNTLAVAALFALACPAFAAPVFAAGDDRLVPLAPGVPLAHPIAAQDLPAPPFSLPADRPVNPAYVPGLPGLKQAVPVKDDFGANRPPKFDSVLIRKSRVENGEVVIPPGGLAYLEDTWGGEVALRGEPLPLLGRMPTYIDYDMSIVIKENVTIPAGQGVVVGGQVYHYYATVGHERTMSHALHVRTIAGQDWEWAFGAPILSTNQPGWWAGQGSSGFTQLYNQGKLREASPQKLVFDWISGVRTDRMLAGDKLFAGMAGPGESWTTGARTIRVAAVDEAAGTVRVEVLEGGTVVLDRTLGPIDPQRLIEDTAARKALVFEHGDLAGFLSPWPEAFKDGKAHLKLYSNTVALAYGQPYPFDGRFTAYPVGCPTGHNFGFMLVNAEEIRLAPGAKAEGPEGYFRVAVNRVENGKVLDWHIEDKAGNRSINLGGAAVDTVDLVLGQGRVAGQAILKDVGKALLNRSYQAAQTATQAAAVTPAVHAVAVPAPAAPPAVLAAATAPASGGLSGGMIGVLGVTAVGIGAIGYEFGRRRTRG
ncbi:hypothetical protein [Azospirillum oleiclasticum]|uniref:hypothetical protein n=1 Tax=Azospirillum oleiclasticum TaxID=2735135 RepID=UPI001B3BFFE8|nr:hypothetical protein [Azospirillum oleiclasticum]